MHASVERLLSVQDVDSQMIFLNEAIRLRPLEVEDEVKKYAERKAELDALLARMKDIRKSSDSLELEVKSLDVEIEKIVVAQNQAKTNAEYTIYREQIERHKGRRSDLEEQVLAKLTELDELEELQKESQERLDVAERALKRKQEEVGQVVSGLSKQLEELKISREELVVDIEPDHLGIYEKVLHRYNDFAIARIEGNTCQGCHMSVTPQDLSLLMQDQFVKCKSCYRILYLE